MLEFSKKIALAMAVPTVALSGCYVVPIAPDGTAAIYPYPYFRRSMRRRLMRGHRRPPS